MIVAFVMAFALQISVTEIPFLIDAFGTYELAVKEWLALTALATAPLWFHEIFVFAKFLKKKSAAKNSAN